MRFLSAIAALSVLLTSTAHTAQRYSLVDLGTLGGATSYASAINESGQIVGSAERTDGKFHSFLYDHGVMTDLGTVGTDDSSHATAINSSGQVAGFSSSSVNGITQIFLYSGASMVGIGLGTDDDLTLIRLAGIDDDGEIACSSSLADGDGHWDRGYLYTQGQLRDLTSSGMVRLVDIDQQGRIFGYGFISQALPPRFYDHGKVTSLPALSRAHANPALINNRGEIFGTLGGPNFFIYSHGKVTSLAAPWKGEIAGANDQGALVGTAKFDSHGPAEAFLYANGRQTRLRAIVSGPTGQGWRLIAATGINDAGQIIGYGVSPSGATHAFRLDPPPTITIFGPRRITTSRSRITLRGKSTGHPEQILATTGHYSRHGARPVIGITRWHTSFPLHKGINYLNIRAVNAHSSSRTETVVAIHS